MKRTPLQRKTPLRNRRPMTRKTAIRRVNWARLKARHARDFGPAADIVRAQPCCICSWWSRMQTSPTEAHHEPPRSVGGRSGDLVPLCSEHHSERHTIGVDTFWDRAGIDWQRVRDGMRALVALQQPGDWKTSPEAEQP